MKASVFLVVSAAICISAKLQDPVSSRNAGIIGQRVHTTSGPVDGHPAANASCVSEYLGIPFAAPPIGSLRFSPPQPFISNPHYIINGSRFGYTCPQSVPTAAEIQATYESAPPGILTPVWLSFNLGQLNTKDPIVVSEDCLTLNVWTKPQVGERKKAVMVWIYGGGFVEGATNVPYNYGTHLAEEGDVVVVSINYRLGILGFPGSPGGPYNVALQDIRLAIEWISDNIAVFGGDSSLITIFGQSAGADAIDMYSYAYVEDPIVAGMIQETGTVFSYSQINESAINEAWWNVSAAVGCGNETVHVQQVFECMQKADYNALLAASPTYGFWPSVDNRLVFANYTARTMAGEVAKIPLLIGNNENEAGLAKISSLIENEPLPDAFWDYFNLVHFTCPSGQRANASIYSGVPTWRYRYFGNFPNLRLTANPDSGAWHGEEITIIWDTEPITLGVPKTEAEIQIGDYMRGAWLAFAKDPVNGLRRYKGGWPQWNPAEETLIRLAFDNMTGTNLAFPQEYDAACNSSIENQPALSNA